MYVWVNSDDASSVPTARRCAHRRAPTRDRAMARARAIARSRVGARRCAQRRAVGTDDASSLFTHTYMYTLES